jgi:hypothetical protein
MPVSREIWTFENQGNHYGRELFYGFFHCGVTNGLAANASGSQGGATALGATTVNRFTTVAGAGHSAILTTPAAGGLLQIVINHGANAMNLFPASGHNIILANGTDLGANTALSVPAGSLVWLVSLDDNTWLVVS